ncbi:hypothetical protein V5O48_015434 [Marasmius crinis-equi]|uniref:F-box domain-containing protein n=1 Tax=Marasmius crinis-equi TaxID=585013 RepID=A0ABR3EUI9_9AGAR
MVSTEDFDIPEPRCVPGPELRPELETRLRNLEPIFVQESDRRDITRFLGEVEVDFAVYDSIIRDLEEKISKVKVKRSSLQSYADRYRSLLCPVRRLPFELVQEIFIFASVAGVEGGNMIGVYSRWESTAMRISSVCHRWRTIALNTPELWASFAVKLERQAREPIELFLSRSKDTPLCLTLMEADDGDDGIAHDDGVLTSLVAHSTRWQSVDWYDLRHTTGLYIIEGIQALPLLQEVVCLAEEEDSAIIHSELLKQCPLLQTVFVRYDFYNNVRVDSLPLASAKNLVFQYGQDGSFTNSLEILRECADTVETISYESIPDLTHFYFFLEASHSPQSPVTPVKCKNVMEMAVNLYSHKGTYPHIRDIFESLTLPSLTSLFLVGDCDKSATNPYGGFEGAWPGLAFENFVIRSRCGITEMEIQGIPIHESELIDVLQRTPTLENFSFAEFCAMDYGDSSLEISPGILVKTINRLILSRLQVQVSESSPTDSKEPLLPKLRRLELRVQRHFDADVQFINMLKSRWYHPASTFVVNPPFRHSSLRSASLYIVGRHGSLEHLYEPIKAIEREGMMVVVNEGGKVIV